MNTKIYRTITVISLFLIATSCSKSDDGIGELGGSQSAIGDVTNNFQITGFPTGISGVSAKITNLSDGVSTVSYSAKVTSTVYQEMISSLEDVSLSGGIVQRESKYKITSEGMESIYPEGNLTLVRYDGNVGDVYSLKRGSKTITREVTSKSSTDDYSWNGMNIKTIKVNEKGRNIPGVNDIQFIFNHKYGIVGIKISFEDGTSKEIGIVSTNQN